MANINPILVQNIDELKMICQRHQVKHLYAFGSVCTNKFNEESDIDFIITFNQRFFNGYVDNFLSLESELSGLFQRKIDLVEESTLQNPYFIKVANQSKKLVYG